MINSGEGMRIEPQRPAHAYKTYQIITPLTTHFRPGTCDEVDCPQQAHGWRTAVDEATELGQRQAHYIRSESRRKYSEARSPEGLTVFTFEAGQRCFAEHRVRLDRPEHFLVRGGDWRGDPYGGRPYVHSSPDDWVEDFALHQQGVADQIEKG